MPNINRFYTPSLPVYTSQFVEDRTPWDEMIGLEQMKIQRSDAAMEREAEIDAMMSSLTPGYRTQKIAPEVAAEYKQQLDNWMQNYGSTSYSIPALRELSKIRANWANDPDVKLIAQDYQASKEYDMMRRDPMYHLSIDPNVNRDTGELTQFERGQAFTPYSPTFDINSYLNKELSVVDKRTVPYHGVETYKDEESGLEIPLLVQGTNIVRDETDFDPVRQDIVDNLNKALPGYFREGELEQMIRERESKFYVNQPDERVSQVSGVSPKTSGKPPDEGYSFTFNLPNEAMLFRSNATSFNAPQDLSKFNTLLSGINKGIANLTKGNKVLYDEIKNDPAEILRLADRGDVEGGGILRKAFIAKRMEEDPYGTLNMFEDYFGKIDEEIKGLNEKEKRPYEAEKENIMKYINKWFDAYNIEPGKTFINNIDSEKAIYAILESGQLNSEDSPFKGISESEFINMNPDDYTPEQRSWMKGTAWRYLKDINKRGTTSLIKTLPEDLNEYLTDVFAAVDANGKIVGNPDNITSTLQGSRLIDPEDPNREFREKDKRKLIQKDDIFKINGLIPAYMSQYGPGMLSVTIGDKNYYIQGPLEWVENQRFVSNAFSMEYPNSLGAGDIFSIRGFGIDRETGFNIDVVDRWNEDKAGQSISDVPMMFRKTYVPEEGQKSQLYTTGEPPQGRYELVVYQKDPRNDPESEYNKPYSKDNPKGYMSVTVPTSIMSEGKLDPMAAKYFALKAWSRIQASKGRDTMLEETVLDNIWKQYESQLIGQQNE